MVNIDPIGIEDAILVRGKRLYKRDGTPFIVKGIAFPTPPEAEGEENLTKKYAWLDVLKQLRVELDLDFNTVRMYRMYPDKVDYHEFFNGAASLGIYVIVPLTSASGAGVLDRTVAAPKCYNKTLFGYGATALQQYVKYPNVLAGMVGNEVMNDENAWYAAPCIRAYARDLKLFMDRMVESDENAYNRTIPLIYAAQDSSVLGGAEVDKDKVMKLTADYLTCAESGKGTLVADTAGDEPKHGLGHFSENKFGQSPVDIIGVNVESWCSSTQDFRSNPDGTPGPYYSLYEALRNTSVPIIFSEMGCPHSQFDRDDLERNTKEGTRDWKQVPIVLNEMAGSWSGFIAYTYDGPKDFNMMAGGPWSGNNTLTPTKDLYNFKKQLGEVSGTTLLLNGTEDNIILPRPCSSVKSELMKCCNLRVFNDDMMQSYQKTVNVVPSSPSTDTYNQAVWYAVPVLIVVVLALFVLRRRHKLILSRETSFDDSAQLQSNVFYYTNDTSKYGSI